MTRLSKPTAQDLKEELERLCSIAVGGAFSFDAPEIRNVYKDIAPSSARDDTFLTVLRTAMEKKRIPLKDIRKMLAEWDAAPAPESLFGW